MSEKSQSSIPSRAAGDIPHSLVLLNTGNGKGKSTAALGVVLRALAQDWPVCVVQFLKSERWSAGEEVICRRLGVTWLKGGDGFTWSSSDLSESRNRALGAWAQAKRALSSNEYRLVVLDEVTYPLAFGWIGVEEVVEAIRSRQAEVNVVATGRGAPDSLIALADTVTEMVNVRHPLDRGIYARAGIDF